MGIDSEARQRLMAMTATIGGSVGRTLRGGFGGVTPILAHGAGIPADLYGLHQEEILKQPEVTLGAGLIPHAMSLVMLDVPGMHLSMSVVHSTNVLFSLLRRVGARRFRMSMDCPQTADDC